MRGVVFQDQILVREEKVKENNISDPFHMLGTGFTQSHCFLYHPAMGGGCHRDPFMNEKGRLRGLRDLLRV